MKPWCFLWFVAGALVVTGAYSQQCPISSASGVDDWLRQLQHDAQTGSNKAAFAFDPTDVDSLDAAKRLISAMKHDSPYFRRHVIVALGELAEPPELVVPALIAALQDEDRSVRKFALGSLLRIGATATPYLASAMADTTVIEAQGDVESHEKILVADYAAFALSRVDGGIVSSCLDVLKAQIEIDKPNRQLPEVDSLEQRLADVRRRLNNSWGGLSDDNPIQLANEYATLRDRLAVLLVSEDYLLRTAVVIRSRKGRDIQSLLPLFASEQAPIQRMALLAVGPESELAVSALTKLLYGDSETLQEEALLALQRIGEPGASVVAKAMLDHPNAEIRQAASNASLAFESAAANLIEALRSSEDEKTRIAAANALSYAFFKPRGAIESATGAQLFEPQLLEQQAILALAETLDNDSKALQAASAQGLRSLVLGPHPSLVPLLPNLIKQLQDSDGEVKADIASVLGAIGEDAAPAIPILLSEIETLSVHPLGSVAPKTDDLKKRLIRAIGGIGVRTEQVETALLAILQDAARASEHAQVVEALGQLRIENAVPAIVQHFAETQEEFGGWSTAAEALLNIEPLGVDALTGLLTDEGQPSAVRQRASRALAKSRSTNEGVASALIAATSDSDALVRLEAAHGLASRQIAGERAVPVLAQWLPHLNRASGGLRKALNSLRAYPEPAAATLVDLLQKISDTAGHEQIIASLRERQKNDPRLAPAITYLESLAREDIERYAAGMEVLGEIGIVNDQTVSLAIAGLSNTDVEVRRNSALALRNLQPADPQVAIAALSELLRRETETAPNPVSAAGDYELPQPRAHAAALDALASYGADARDSLPVLVALLSHASPSIRADAADAMGGIGMDAEEVRSKLVELLDDPEWFVRDAAAQALLAIGAGPESLGSSYAERAITAALDNDLDPFLRELSPSLSITVNYQVGRGYGLPPLPWPPPRYTHRAVFGRDIPRSVLGEDDTTLGEIYDKLYHAFSAADERFESGLFGVGHDGFAILAKLERIDRQGDPLPGDNRWVYGELPPLNIKDYVGRLFFERPGYFRIIAFVVTPERLVGHSDAPLPHISEGASELPGHIAKLTFKGRNCYALIYSFERRRGGKIRLFDNLSAKTHLLKSGVLASF